MALKILFGISLITNGLLLFWGIEQRNVAYKIDGYWKDRDGRRIKSIQLLKFNL